MITKPPVPPREFGRDGISNVVDADRALRVREVGAEPTPPNRLRRGLLARIEGRSALWSTPKKDVPPAEPTE